MVQKSKLNASNPTRTSSLSAYPSHRLPHASCVIGPYNPPSAQPISEQVWQNETWRFGLHTVDPEVCTAGVVLVSSVRQLEVVRFGIKGLKERELKQV